MPSEMKSLLGYMSSSSSMGYQVYLYRYYSFSREHLRNWWFFKGIYPDFLSEQKNGLSHRKLRAPIFAAESWKEVSDDP